MKKVMLLFLGLILISCGGGDDEDVTPATDLIYLSSNGVTIKCPNAEVGYTEEVNGKVYQVVDRDYLRAIISLDYDLTCICTSSVTDMSEMFFF